MADKSAKELADEQKQLAKEAAEAADQNEAPDGGRFLNEQGELVDANGEPVTKKKSE